MKYSKTDKYKKKIKAAIRFCRHRKHLQSFDLVALRKVEDGKFSKYGFDYGEALKVLGEVASNSGLSDQLQFQKGMASVHWTLFSCLAKNESIKNILEIGTYDGSATKVLSQLFPEGRIETVDLPADDPILRNSYSRSSQDALDSFRRRQKANLGAANICYHSVNSLFLPSVLNGKKFDLIWIDGGHLYPEVAWDICNAYHMCSDGGWIMCDDIIPRRDGFRNEQVSPDSYEVLEYLVERTGDEITYFLKREDPVWSADPDKRKFVALMQKTNKI